MGTAAPVVAASEEERIHVGLAAGPGGGHHAGKVTPQHGREAGVGHGAGEAQQASPRVSRTQGFEESDVGSAELHRVLHPVVLAQTNGHYVGLIPPEIPGFPSHAQVDGAKFLRHQVGLVAAAVDEADARFGGELPLGAQGTGCARTIGQVGVVLVVPLALVAGNGGHVRPHAAGDGIADKLDAAGRPRGRRQQLRAAQPCEFEVTNEGLRILANGENVRRIGQALGHHQRVSFAGELPPREHAIHHNFYVVVAGAVQYLIGDINLAGGALETHSEVHARRPKTRFPDIGKIDTARVLDSGVIRSEELTTGGSLPIGMTRQEKSQKPSQNSRFHQVNS